MINSASETLSERFPIRELSLRTGVNSVTLRAWERRYGLLKPLRTEKGHRLYTKSDVLRVEKILYWINQGVSVSKVRALLDQQLESVDSESVENTWREWQSECITAIRKLSQTKWEKLLQETIKQYPFGVMVQNGLLPVLAALKDDVAEKCYFQSSLAELITVLKLAPRHVAKVSGEVRLLVSCDGSPLMAKLIAWELTERQEHFVLVEGVSSRQELSLLEQRLGASQTIIVAERYTENEAKQWLLSDQDLSDKRIWIGSGLWLRGRDLANQNPLNVYSSVADYLQSIA
ncbi:hypothetical protein DN730_09590 [Marinomonas piezotolerans]|uniref:HTH merR-type domain-containing protein n=1 Tax=Marinomonas piezotolerans TaxID=2213058 RepID=A0A370UA46_9GAMM|nr:MerR family transcriptional regulator [Marinomonas piezotolerans]RDL44628.1 hypothetical protein DN730_09590 [Marinomonas piezotolerans]